MVSRSSLSRLVLLLLALTTRSALAEVPVLRLATWNLEHLAADGRNGCRPRSDADFARLRHQVARVGADLIALQEVENRTAARRVFDSSTYAIEISRQPDQDLGLCHRRRSRKRTMQRTGFAINRARLAELGLSYRRLPDFSGIGMDSQRWATRILIEPVDRPGEAIELLSLHLKSGCSYGRLDGKVDRQQCRSLVKQRGILEEWIDARASANGRFVILGDFNRQLDQPNDGFWADIDDGAVCTWTPHPVLGRRCRAGTARPDPDADLVMANAGRPFPFPYDSRYPYAIDHLIFDAKTARWIIPGSYVVPDYEGDHPAPSDHHPVSISLRLDQRP